MPLPGIVARHLVHSIASDRPVRQSGTPARGAANCYRAAALSGLHAGMARPGFDSMIHTTTSQLTGQFVTSRSTIGRYRIVANPRPTDCITDCP